MKSSIHYLFILYIFYVYIFSADSVKLPQRIEVKIPWSKADKKAKGDLWCSYKCN